MDEAKLETLSVMRDLIETMMKACQNGFVDRDEARKHVEMYSGVIQDTIDPPGEKTMQ